MSTEEKLNQAKGAVKEKIGELTGDEKTEKEGFGAVSSRKEHLRKSLERDKIE